MFVVIFEVQPKKERWDDYLALAKQLKPKLEAIDGFIDNIRYRSLTRGGLAGVALDLARREGAGALAHPGRHHGVQEKGRFEVFQRLSPARRRDHGGHAAARGRGAREQRFRRDGDAGAATTVT